MTATTRRRAARQTPPAVAATVLGLVDRARDGLLQACHVAAAAERYELAHLAALRAAAALLAGREGADVSRSGPRNVWAAVPVVAPELAEWAEFFAETSRRRQAVERGSATVSTREADDLVRQCETFLELVLAALGLPMRAPVATCVIPTRSTRPVI
ncbi:hypothetical protein FGL98_07820 [Leekyejoonella antrihumi]|uniref:SAV-6107-like HEPN domain-containing protein n=2 Tax=Leekyejoonella antrihumi TaxID=1660198 RepID=A0A563E424_9MICO|nr:hypothetical protein FGL98_07820 [Leekyejoonella antrihumi]